MLWHIHVRPDDRLSASCCYEENRSNWLEAIVEKSQEIEAKIEFKRKEEDRHSDWKFGLPDIAFLDRTWVEQRIFDGEDDSKDPLSARAQDLRGIFEHHPRDKKCPALLILGELSHSEHLMRSAPCRDKAKPPKETQIYKLEKPSDTSSWNAKYLGTYVPKDFIASATSSIQPPSDVSPNRTTSAPIKRLRKTKRTRLRRYLSPNQH